MANCIKCLMTLASLYELGTFRLRKRRKTILTSGKEGKHMTSKPKKSEILRDENTFADLKAILYLSPFQSFSRKNMSCLALHLLLYRRYLLKCFVIWSSFYFIHVLSWLLQQVERALDTFLETSFLEKYPIAVPYYVGISW